MRSPSPAAAARRSDGWLNQHVTGRRSGAFINCRGVGVDHLSRGALAVEPAALLRRAERAVRNARRAGEPVLLGVTTRLPGDVDPSALAFASRRPGEDWFCFEQPDRDGAALAALGCVTRLQASGEDRFRRLAAEWRALTADAVADAPDGPAGAGLVALGGFAFAPDGGRAPHWAGFAAGDLIVPEVALARRGGDVRLTVAALAAPDDVPEELAARLDARVRGLRHAALPLLDPAPAGRFRIDSVAPPEHYVEAVARAVERIRAGAVREDRARPRGHGAGAHAARRRRRVRRPARRLRVLLRVLRRPRRRGVRGRIARAAHPPRRPARPDRRAGRLHPPLGRPGRGRSPGRAAAAAPTRTARSRRSSPAGSPGCCVPTPSGWPRPRSPR